MNTIQKLERAAAAFAMAVAATAIAVMLVHALHLDWYLTSHGLTEKSQLSEDYGFAFESLLFILGTVVIAFPISVTCSWRLLGKLGFGAHRG